MTFSKEEAEQLKEIVKLEILEIKLAEQQHQIEQLMLKHPHLKDVS